MPESGLGQWKFNSLYDMRINRVIAAPVERGSIENIAALRHDRVRFDPVRC